MEMQVTGTVTGGTGHNSWVGRQRVFIALRAKRHDRSVQRSIVVQVCCAPAQPVKLLLRNRDDDVCFLPNLKIIDDALGVAARSCTAEQANRAGSSNTQELELQPVRMCCFPGYAI